MMMMIFVHQISHSRNETQQTDMYTRKHKKTYKDHKLGVARCLLITFLS